MAAGTAFNKSTTSVENLFKIDYKELGDKIYNDGNVLSAIVKKVTTHEGDYISKPFVFGFGGSVGCGTLPKSSGNRPTKKAIFDVKKVYARALFDRFTVAKAKTGKNSYFKDIEEVVKSTLDSWNRNRERIWFGDGSGALAYGDAATNVSGAGSTADPYVVVLASTTVDANIEEQDLLNYDAETTELLVSDYDPDTKAISLVGTSAGLATLSGSGPVPATKALYIQNSKDAEPNGLGILKKTSGNVYGIDITNRRWKPVQIDAGGTGIDETLINKMLSDMELKTGKIPNLVVTSFKQVEKMKNLQIDLKRHAIKAGKAQMSFPGVVISTDKGDINVVASRFCPTGDMYFLNTKYMETVRTPDGGWFDNDGSVFMRVADEDQYEARYGQYMQHYIQPSHQGVIYDLKIS